MVYIFKYVLGWEWAGCDEKCKEDLRRKTQWEGTDRKTQVGQDIVKNGYKQVVWDGVGQIQLAQWQLSLVGFIE